jgi:hypothetical protein
MLTKDHMTQNKSSYFNPSTTTPLCTICFLNTRTARKLPPNCYLMDWPSLCSIICFWPGMALLHCSRNIRDTIKGAFGQYRNQKINKSSLQFRIGLIRSNGKDWKLSYTD